MEILKPAMIRIFLQGGGESRNLVGVEPEARVRWAGGFRPIRTGRKRNCLQVRRHGEAAAFAPGARGSALIRIPDGIGPRVFTRSIGVIRREEVSVQILINEEEL